MLNSFQKIVIPKQQWKVSCHKLIHTAARARLSPDVVSQVLFIRYKQGWSVINTNVNYTVIYVCY